jgi:hypothetical protein
MPPNTQYTLPVTTIGLIHQWHCGQVEFIPYQSNSVTPDWSDMSNKWSELTTPGHCCSDAMYHQSIIGYPQYHYEWSGEATHCQCMAWYPIKLGTNHQTNLHQEYITARLLIVAIHLWHSSVDPQVSNQFIFIRPSLYKGEVKQTSKELQLMQLSWIGEGNVNPALTQFTINSGTFFKFTNCFCK